VQVIDDGVSVNWNQQVLFPLGKSEVGLKEQVKRGNARRAGGKTDERSLKVNMGM